MFGIGMQEMVIIGVLLLVVFGPGKLTPMARDIGRFVGEARRAVDEFKKDLTSEDSASTEGVDRKPHEGSEPEGRKPEEDASHEEDVAVTRSVPPAQ
jgi:Tat protein translocase TatB subunit